MPTGTIWPLDHGTTLGRVQDACLDAEPCDGGVRSRRVTVLDDAYENSDGSFGCDDGHGGGPLATPEAQRDAIRFGVFNTLVHAERAMAKAEQMVGRQLPRLLVRIGGHGRWGGGHYRLPALALDPEEAVPPVATGEVHLGRGTRYVASPVGRYFNAASHNAAIIAHEVGHHLCRHTADFRLNSQRPPTDQDNGKIPLDEGTCDYFAAVLLDDPDIFGWHRSEFPRRSQQRRAVDGAWTMAAFRGNHRRDPHLDGTVWSAALWSARRAACRTGTAAAEFDWAVGRALVALGRPDARSTETLKHRRYFSRAADAVIEASGALGQTVADSVRAAFVARGIESGYSNAALRDRSRLSAVEMVGDVDV